jgi:hypothetical protein
MVTENLRDNLIERFVCAIPQMEQVIVLPVDDYLMILVVLRAYQFLRYISRLDY